MAFTGNDFQFPSILTEQPLDVLRYADMSPSVGTTVNPLPNLGGLGGGAGNGLNAMQIGGLALGGLQTLGSLWGAFQSLGLAKKQFKFTKDITNTNLANQIKSYNTSLEDRIRSRSVMEGTGQDQADAYLASHSLTRKPNSTAKNTLTGY